MLGLVDGMDIYDIISTFRFIVDSLLGVGGGAGVPRLSRYVDSIDTRTHVSTYMTAYFSND